MSLLMSRYILEIQNDSKLLKLFNEGIWYPNFDEYRDFIHKQERNNKVFAKTVSRYNLIRESDYLIETVSSKDLYSVSFYLDREAMIVESGYGTIKCSSQLPNAFSYPSCYISNGIYHDTEELALNMAGCGSFVIGVCDSSDSNFYNENMERIEEFKKMLNKEKLFYRTYKHNGQREKCLMLYYRSDGL